MLLKNRKMEVRFLKDAEDHIRPVDKESPMSQNGETGTDVQIDRVMAGGKALIQTYFAWKMADRVLEKILR